MSYRYTLHRTVTPTLGDIDRGLLVWIMLNPSTADDQVDDPTIRRVKQFTADAGYSELHVVNLFARRCTRPVHLHDAGDPVGPDNDQAIREALDMADEIVEAYGAWNPSWRGHLLPRRDMFVHDELARRARTSVCLGVTARGWPRHPLYVKATQPLVVYRSPSAGLLPEVPSREHIVTVDRAVVDQAVEVIERSLLVEVNGGELEPIWQIYKPEGVALVIRQALMNAGLLVDDLDRAVLDAADVCASAIVNQVHDVEPYQRLIAAVDARRAANGSER